MKSLLLAAIFFMATAAVAQTPAPAMKGESEIRSAIETFRTSIIAKDKARFLQLFHGESIPWLAVYDDQSLKLIRQKKPDFAKANPLGTPGPVAFIDGIVETSARKEEKLWNVRIDSDGQVASVSFDYSFHSGDYKSNWGQEAWQPVHTGQGWKINSVIYSVHLNPEPRPATSL